MILATVKKAQELFENKDQERCIALLKSAIPLARLALNMVDTVLLYKLIASLHFDNREYDAALKVCHIVNYVTGMQNEHGWFYPDMEQTLT